MAKQQGIELVLERSGLFRHTNWLLLISGMWFAVALILISHFRFYYDVAWSNAIKWGTGDGLIWASLFALFIHCHYRFRKYFQSISGTISFLGLAILSGVILHPTISTLLFWLIDGSISRPFHEDVMHLAMKRLPQGILAGLATGITGVMITYMKTLPAGPSPAERQTDSRPSFAPPSIAMKDAGGVRRFLMSDIVYLEAAGNYVTVHTRDGEHLYRTTLKHMKQRLAGHRFHRISRKHIVNLECVRSVQSARPKGGLASLENGASLPVSRQYKTSLQDALASTPDHPPHLS